jgi:hypothetical protein
MTTRKVYSDSRLTRLMKPDDDSDLNKFLPKFLVKDIISKDDSERSNIEHLDTSTDNIIVEPDEEHTGAYNINEMRQQQPTAEKETFKPIRSRFNSSGDVRAFARDYKNQLFNHFQNTISRNVPSAFGANNNQRQRDTKTPEVNYNNYGHVYFDQYNFGIFNPYNSANDTTNSSILEDFNNFLSLRPQPKRTNSSANLDYKSRVVPKSKNSLFQSSDKEDRCEDFEDVQQLLSSIDCELWVYARTQKGSRNLQKLLNKIQPEGLDIILEKIKSNFYQLMTDTYGNYFCQKLIQCCSADQRMFILRNVRIYLTKDNERVRSHFL